MAAPAGSGILRPQLARVERLPPAAGPAPELAEARVGVAAPLLVLLAGTLVAGAGAAAGVAPQAERLPLAGVPAAAASPRTAEVVAMEIPLAGQVPLVE
ncbi:MAG: hypothetical protein K6U89_02900 [Chloroflexi bacterium]|nr:hypothetical protein [Chloroflexota bacterium]